jgi:hypothetical protein
MLLGVFARRRCNGMQLAVFSFDQYHWVPKAPRILALPSERVPRSVYNRRLRTLDLLVFPFESNGMLGTGVAAEVIGAGLPALISNWAYLRETLGGRRNSLR